MRWFFIILLSVCTNSFSEPLQYPVTKNSIGPHLEFRVNGITDFKIPIEVMVGSKVIVLDGLILSIKDKGDISFETITSASIGFPKTDMRLWPSYVMGYQKMENDSDYSKEMNNASKVFESSYKPYKSGVFITATGKGFVALGKESSVIYLIGDDTREFITSINIKNMAEDDINNLIIQGLL